MGRRAIIIGAGQIGRAVALHFARNGWDVIVLNRSQPEFAKMNSKITWVKVDRTDTGLLERAVGEGADFLLDTISFDKRDAQQLIGLADRIGLLAVISSGSVYCDKKGRNLSEAVENGFPRLPERLTEDQATVAPGPKNYSTRKMAMESTLLSGEADVSILRPCAIYGQSSRHPREWWFVKRMRDERNCIPLSRRGESQFQTSAAVNIAALIFRIAETGASGIFNAVDPDCPNVHEIGQAIASHIGTNPVFSLQDGSDVGRTPWSVPEPFTLSNTKARNIGYVPIGGYRDCIGPTLDWLMKFDDEWQKVFPQLAAYPYDLFDYAAEDQYFEAR